MLQRFSLLLVLVVTLIMASCSPVNAPGAAQEPPADSSEPIVTPSEPQPTPELPMAFMVMVDNHSGARPQCGLDKADIVYELVCETGITRFLAAFYSQDPICVGPIRSIRYYYLQVAKPYDLPLVHVGGNMDAMALRTSLGIKSVCAITNAGATFFVDGQRKSPHATFTTSQAVLALASKRGYEPRSLPALPCGQWPAAPEVPELHIEYSSKYAVAWVYDAGQQCYNRLINGSPHITAEQESIRAHNIIIIEAPVKTVEVPVDGIQSEINIIGQGKALFLREGKLLSGNWYKEKPEAHFRYSLDDGSEVTFAPGKVWVQQVPSLSGHVTYK